MATSPRDFDVLDLPPERAIDFALVERFRVGGEDGDLAAREIVERHEDYCRKTARRLHRRAADPDDELVWICLEAFFDAVPTWNPMRAALRTHATFFMRKALREVRRTSRNVLLPHVLTTALGKADRAGVPRVPSALRAAGFIGPTSELEDGDLIGGVRSVDVAVSSEMSAALFGDALRDAAPLADERCLNAEVLDLARDVAADMLSNGELYVWRRRLDGVSQPAIALEIGVSRSAVGMIEARAEDRVVRRCQAILREVEPRPTVKWRRVKVAVAHRVTGEWRYA